MDSQSIKLLNERGYKNIKITTRLIANTFLDFVKGIDGFGTSLSLLFLSKSVIALGSVKNMKVME